MAEKYHTKIFSRKKEIPACQIVSFFFPLETMMFVLSEYNTLSFFIFSAKQCCKPGKRTDKKNTEVKPFFQQRCLTYTVMQSDRNSQKTDTFHKPITIERHVQTNNEKKTTFARHESGPVGVFGIKIRSLLPKLQPLEKCQFSNCSHLIASHCIFRYIFTAVKAKFKLLMNNEYYRAIFRIGSSSIIHFCDTVLSYACILYACIVLCMYVL